MVFSFLSAVAVSNEGEDSMRGSVQKKGQWRYLVRKQRGGRDATECDQMDCENQMSDLTLFMVERKSYLGCTILLQIYFASGVE